MDGKRKRERVTHQLSITKPRPEIDTCAASRSLRVLYHEQVRRVRSCNVHAPHGVTCAGAKDGLGTTMGKVLRPTASRFKDAETTYPKRGYVSIFYVMGEGGDAPK